MRQIIINYLYRKYIVILTFNLICDYLMWNYTLIIFYRISKWEFCINNIVIYFFIKFKLLQKIINLCYYTDFLFFLYINKNKMWLKMTNEKCVQLQI
jgi:hypothetical protein